MKKFLQLFVMFLLLAGTTAMAGTKFAVATGIWSATSTWSTTRGGASGATAPTATDTVYIPSPYMVTVDASGKNCFDLIVETGAALIGNALNPSSAQVYVKVAGDSVVNNGIIGYDPALGPNSPTVLSFEANTKGKTVTFLGTGDTRISRLRNNSSVDSTTIVIAQNVTLTYPGSTGSGGDGYYTQTTTGNKLVINAGDTLTCVDQCNIGTASSTTVDGPSATFQVDGALIMKGINSTFHLRPLSGAVVSLIVNGLVDIGHNLTTVGASGTTATITVNAGGVLKTGTTGTGIVNFDNAAQTVTGAGTFQLAGGKITIGAAAGLDPANGPIRTTTRIFATTGSYSYQSNVPQVTGADLPANVAFLTVLDTNTTLTMSKNLTVDTLLSLSKGKLLPGTFTLVSKDTAVSAGSSTFVEGNLSIPVLATSAKLYTVGQDTEALPLTAYFGAVTGTGNLTVGVVNKTVTGPSASLTAMNKVLNRYYHVVKASTLTAVKADSLVLHYSPVDVAGAGTVKDSLRVFISTGTSWSSVPVVRRDTAANVLVAGPLTSFNDIVITGADPTVPTLPLPTYSIGTGTIFGESGHFASLKAACDTINAHTGAGITSDMLFYITSDLTEAKNVNIGANTNGHTITFKPYTGLTPKITFAQTTDNAGLSGGWVIGVKDLVTPSGSNYGLTAADSVEHIVIDGSNTDGGTTRDLSIVTAAGINGNTNPIRIIGNSNFITVKNVNVTTGQSVSYAILITPRFSTINYIPDNITVDNCNITNTFGSAAQGIAISASGTPTVFSTGMVFSNNKITATTRGIFLNYSGNTDIVGNEIHVIQPGSGLFSEGIYAFVVGSGTSVTNIYNNKIVQLSTGNNVTAGGIYGMWLGSVGVYNVYNNMISGFALPTAFKGIATGIGVSSGVSPVTANVYNNSVYLPKNAATADTSAPTHAAFLLNLSAASGVRVANVQNNIFADAETSWTAQAFYWADSNKTTLTSTNNVLYTAGGKARTGRRGNLAIGDAATLADWKTLSGVDTNSVAGNPQFVSTSDLHINVNATPTSSASNAGTFIASVPKDIDGDLRSSTTPDIGADEFTAVFKAPVLTLTPALLNFKNVVVNSPVKDSVTVKNTGTDSLFISNVVSSDPAYTVTPTTARLDTGASKKFTITYTPTTAGMKMATVLFTSNTAKVTDTLRVSGSGLAPITIADVRKDLNGDLVADRSVTKDTVFFYGVINSPNYGVSYPQLANFIQDSTGGLEVFGYTLPDPPLVPGDSIYVIGTVAQYKGLVEVTPLAIDSAHFGVLKHNAKVAVKKPTLHAFMQNPESYEGQLVELDTLYKASGTWPAAGAGASIYVTNAAKTDTIQLYIDSDTDIDGSTEPKYPINLVGVISQYKAAAPWNAGYEIMPRYLTDITPIVVTGLADASGLPTVYSLSNNYPNPFNPSTQIKFALPQTSMAKLIVYDMLGREVKTLVNNTLNAGYFNITWDGSNNHGVRVSSGMYIYRLEAGTFTQSKKMMLLK
jgi:hypothetical protein